MDVKPWEPVDGWFVARGNDAIDCEARRSWEFTSDSFKLIEISSTLQTGGSCRVTIANGQRIIVRALSEERKAARRARQEVAQ